MTDQPWAPAGAGSDDDLTAVFRERWHPADPLLLAAVPALLAVLFAWVGEAPASLTLSYEAPTWRSAVTAHFVHRSAGHVAANLATYGFVVPLAYVLAVLSGRRRSFLLALVGFPVVLPPLLSGLSLLALERGVTFGFSGVTMAYVGLLAVSLGHFLDRRLEAGPAEAAGLGLSFLGLAFVASRTIPPTTLRLAGVVGAAGIAAVYLRKPVRFPTDAGTLTSIDSRAVQLAGTATLAFGLGLLVGFPDPGPGGEVLTNTIGHLLGFVFGFAIPVAAARLVGPGGVAGVDGPDAV